MKLTKNNKMIADTSDMQAPPRQYIARNAEALDTWNTQHGLKRPSVGCS